MYKNMIMNNTLSPEALAAAQAQGLALKPKEKGKSDFSSLMQFGENVYQDAKQTETQALTYVMGPKLGQPSPNVEALTYHISELGMIVDTFVGIRDSVVSTIKKLTEMQM